MATVILPDPENEIPRQLMADNWAFHVLVRSDDPAIKCLNIKNLVLNLKTTILTAGLSNSPFFDEQFNFETTLGKFLDYQSFGANKSWNAYTQGRTGEAVEKANAVLSKVLFIVYDDRFTATEKNSFTARV